MSEELRGWKVAVLGGDSRMLQHMQQALEAGAEVAHYGSPRGSADVAGPATASLEEAVAGARLISCPIPGVADDGALYAPHASEKLYVTTAVLKGAAPNALLFSGRVPQQMEQWGQGTGVTLIGYGDDDPLAILHAVPTAEGAVQVAIQNTEETILGLPTLCIGMGRVGISVVQAFEGLKANVTIAARNPTQLARAWATNAKPLHLSELPDRIGDFKLIVSSASSMVLANPLLERVRDDALVIDLCSPPGSVDFEAAKGLGVNVIWARGQAGTAPRTSGYNEWQVLMRIVREHAPTVA